ncbi:MAG: glycosyltransferase involved in cell wall biosynthesis [Loktanella salsilacus]|jgi:glycosyltransferase involved in cell wall biosynthesis|uniref:Glycosyltransferase involved in cell wall bisynthesis n=1 Tax=Loktanella salsilacus TaxID=195913 RepID=A0A1I4FHR9_9RHOB|nr:glycosyltransferase [Loktanella salsilacus]SFL17505.1 Glycosyltransferase involved in cell wall bisynthesis [Loktanella salsilacus]
MPEDSALVALAEADLAPPARVALIHYWLVGMRGGERVLEEMLKLYPDADIFTHVVDRDKISPALAARPITQTFVGRLPGARKHYQKYLGLMPRALEELDLSAYDLVLSSESGPAKGVITRPDATHICYCHSPMRYIWDHYAATSAQLGWLQRKYFSQLAHRLRQWDTSTAARVDHFIANSRFVAARIDHTYRRDAAVVHPPVDLDLYGPADADGAPVPQADRGYYLYVSQLVPYKRADLAIDAFRGLDLPLKVVGQGSEFERLSQNAPDNVQMLGRVEDADMPDLYRGARALIFPAEEDFGIVPVEAMACGTPVLAYGRGGALDSVVQGKTGLFFPEQTVPSLQAAIGDFEARRDAFDPARIARHAQGFGAERFRIALKAQIDGARRRHHDRFAVA